MDWGLIIFDGTPSLGFFRSKTETTMIQTVLLAGATGMFGSHIARHLLDQPAARLRLLLRDRDSTVRKEALKPLLDRGAVFVEGDLTDRASLDRATDGVDVIVSAVQGVPK